MLTVATSSRANISLRRLNASRLCQGQFHRNFALRFWSATGLHASFAVRAQETSTRSTQIERSDCTLTISSRSAKAEPTPKKTSECFARRATKARRMFSPFRHGPEYHREDSETSQVGAERSLRHSEA